MPFDNRGTYKFYECYFNVSADTVSVRRHETKLIQDLVNLILTDKKPYESSTTRFIAAMIWMKQSAVWVLRQSSRITASVGISRA